MQNTTENKAVPWEDMLLSPIQEQLIQVLETGPMTRAELVKQLDEPRTTIYDNLMGLMTRNRVRKFSRPVNEIGRPLVFFALVKEN